MTRAWGRTRGGQATRTARGAEGACGGRVSLSSFLFCLFQEAQHGQKAEWGRQAFSSSYNGRTLHGRGGRGQGDPLPLSCSKGPRRRESRASQQTTPPVLPGSPARSCLPNTARCVLGFVRSPFPKPQGESVVVVQLSLVDLLSTNDTWGSRGSGTVPY